MTHKVSGRPGRLWAIAGWSRLAVGDSASSQSAVAPGGGFSPSRVAPPLGISDEHPMPKHEPGPPMDLANMRRQGVACSLIAYCLNDSCRHQAIIATHELKGRPSASAAFLEVDTEMSLRLVMSSGAVSFALFRSKAL
jgi:hypothetical protein